MTKEKETELFIEISRSLGEMNSKLGALCDAISKHEQRIQKLEAGKASLKDSVIELLVKGLIGSILVIASLTGSAGLISKILVG